jgi:hypothetical protein
VAKYIKKTPIAPTLGDPEQREDPILGYRRRAPAGWTNFREPTPLYNASEEAIRDTIRRWALDPENEGKFALTKDNILQTLLAIFADLEPDERVEYIKTGLVTLNRVYDREVARIKQDIKGMKKAAETGVKTVSTPRKKEAAIADPTEQKPAAAPEQKPRVRAGSQKTFGIIRSLKPRKRNYG